MKSWIRDPQQREILFDLDRAIATVLAEQGKTEVHSLLSKNHSNLLRLWDET